MNSNLCYILFQKRNECVNIIYEHYLQPLTENYHSQKMWHIQCSPGQVRCKSDSSKGTKASQQGFLTGRCLILHGMHFMPNSCLTKWISTKRFPAPQDSTRLVVLDFTKPIKMKGSRTSAFCFAAYDINGALANFKS